MNHLLEVCVDSLESALAAQSGGADRLELCANLLIGGTSPSPALIEEVLAAVTIPVNVLLRPRFGDFCFTDAEKRILIREAETCRDLGVHGGWTGTIWPSASRRAARTCPTPSTGPSTSAGTPSRAWRTPWPWALTPF